jgi:hypothetical protein
LENRDMVFKSPIEKKKTPEKTLRLGFVPLADCAPLVMARELGLFAKYGLRVVRNFSVFHREQANEPSSKKALWVLQLMRESGQCPDPAALSLALGRKIFRTDIFEKVARLRGSAKPTEHEIKIEDEPAHA